MAKIFTIISQQTPAMSVTSTVASGTAASIGVGTPTFIALSWAGTVAVGADGDGTTSKRFAGLAKSVSTETASAAGTVETWEPFAGIVYNGFAKTSSTADTLAEIQALKGKRVVFDLTSSDWTIDAAASDAKANAVTLLGTGDANLATLNFVYASHGTHLDFCVSAEA